MGALNALQRSPSALIRNPVLVIPVLIIGLFQLPQLLLQATNPFLASLVSSGISLLFIFIMPFFQAGIIGMADEALEGQTRLHSFIADGKAHYVNVLVAYLLLLVIYGVLGVLLLILAFVGGLFVLPHLNLSGIGLGFLALFFLLFVLIFFLSIFFLQFYAQAIVLDNEKAIAGIKRSYRVVRRNLVSTLGYTLIGAIFGGGLGLILGGLSMIASPQTTQFIDLPEITFPTLAGAIILVIVIASLIGSFLAIFSVAFYREINS